MPHSPRHIVVLVLAAAAAFLAAAAPAAAAPVCGEGTYAYAGFTPASVTRGVSASIAQAGPLDVRAGHVAGWVGVVDPDGDAWLQTGLSALPGDTTSQIYYEVAVPGHDPVYRDVRRFVDTGEQHRFAVLEVAQRPSWWRVWVDGQPVTAPIHLQGSHDRWKAQVLGESWAGTTSGACNSYAYAFSGVSLLDPGHRDLAGLTGQPMNDPHYTLVHRSPSSFVATSVGGATAA